jgi:hypothetical protein
MLNLISGALSSVKTYLVLGGVVIVAALFFRGELLKSQRDAARSELQIAVGANKTLQGTLADLEAQAGREDELLRELQGIRSGLAQDAADRRSELARLARDNEDVEDALSRPLPLGLVCLRDAANGVANPLCADQGQP